MNILGFGWFLFISIWPLTVLSLVQLPKPRFNLTATSGGYPKLLLVDWRSKALDKHPEANNSTLRRRECWIMEMGPEDDWTKDVVKCTDKKAPTLRQLIAHGRNGTEFGKADAAHMPVFYTGWKNPNLGAAGGLAGTNPSEKILWYINRSFKGYESPKPACNGGLVLRGQIYTYSDMARDSWFIAQMAEMENHREDYPEYVSKEYGFSPRMTLTWCYCQALASAAMPSNGEAWVAMPWDTDDWGWLAESNWNLNEMPALTQNPAIKVIKRFDPKWYFYNPDRVWPNQKDMVEKAQPRVLWERSNPDHPVFEQEWKCPLP